MAQSKTYYRRHLPHYQPPDSAFHIVFRLASSLPVEAVPRMRADLVAHEKSLEGINTRETAEANVERQPGGRRVEVQFDPEEGATTHVCVLLIGVQ